MREVMTDFLLHFMECDRGNISDRMSRKFSKSIAQVATLVALQLVLQPLWKSCYNNSGLIIFV